MSTAMKEHLRVQLLTPGLAAGQCSVLNTLRAPSMAISCVTWGCDREQKLDSNYSYPHNRQTLKD